MVLLRKPLLRLLKQTGMNWRGDSIESGNSILIIETILQRKERYGMMINRKLL